MINPSISFRPINEEDMSDLLEMYASTRQEEMKQVPNWTEMMKTQFISSQFRVQHDYYQKNYTGADFWIIEMGSEKIGRLYLHENFEEGVIRIIDITLLPRYRNRKIGEGILKDLMKKATVLKKPLSIHVEAFNPAKTLYNRLGFKKISETNGVYHLMEWNHTI